MKIQEIRRIAKNWDVDTRVTRSKQDIIRDIQIREGNTPCFHTKKECANDCLWKEDCLQQDETEKLRLVRGEPYVSKGVGAT